MNIDEFDFHLPKELIAQYPAEKRDKCRLLVYKGGEIIHRVFENITDYLEPGDCLVLNDTKVLKARLYGKKETKGKIEVFFIRQLSPKKWKVLLDQHLKIGSRFFLFDENAVVCERDEEGYTIEFEKDIDFLKFLDEHGEMPLPHYIKRKPDESDEKMYQTVYAKQPGSIAAPTAGLHFTNELLEKIKTNGVKIAYLTLHIGVDTFRSIKVQDVTKHKMLGEYYSVGSEAAETINNSKLKGRKVIAVGTTSVKTLETVADEKGFISAKSGISDLFIYPGYKFKAVDALVTNFHLPKSTNFILVCSFVGRENALKIYSEAIKSNYKFYSYGDSSLLFRS